MPKGGIVVMDRMEIGGIATEETPADNRAGMRAQGSIDRGVARSPTRVFDPEVATTTVTTAGQEEIAVYRDCVESREEDATPYSEDSPALSFARAGKEGDRSDHPLPGSVRRGIAGVTRGIVKTPNPEDADLCAAQDRTAP